jgi:hypothetical protein
LGPDQLDLHVVGADDEHAVAQSPGNRVMCGGGQWIWTGSRTGRPGVAVQARERHRNKRKSGADWRFTTADARVKLERLYPAVSGSVAGHKVRAGEHDAGQRRIRPVEPRHGVQRH